MNIFRQKLAAGKTMMGFEVDLADPCITEMASSQGFDFLWIDIEHEAVNHETVLMQIIACKAGGAASLVRVPWNEPYLAKRILEMGPDGIIFPMVNSYKEAQKAMSACLYPPLGTRGFGPRRACDYCREDLSKFIAEHTERQCRFVQVENVSAVKDLDRILEVPYLDGIIVGPCDLSGSIGRLNDVYHPEVIALIDETLEKCRAHHKPAGIAVGADTPEQLRFWLDKGFSFISAGSDMCELSGAMKRRKAMMEVVLAKR